MAVLSQWRDKKTNQSVWRKKRGFSLNDMISCSITFQLLFKVILTSWYAISVNRAGTVYKPPVFIVNEICVSNLQENILKIYNSLLNMNADVRWEERNSQGFLECALQWVIQIICTYGIFGVLAALYRVSTGCCNNVCAGHICYLGHIISYTVLAESQIYLSCPALWEMFLISVEKTSLPEKYGSGEGWLYQMNLIGCLPSPWHLVGWNWACSPGLFIGFILSSLYAYA